MHAVVALGDAVAAADGPEFAGGAAVFFNAGADITGNALQVILSRADIVPGIDDSNKWFFEIFVIIAHRAV